MEDFAVLASMLTNRDLRTELSTLDVWRLRNMIAKVTESRLLESVDGAARGVGALKVALRRYGGN